MKNLVTCCLKAATVVTALCISTTQLPAQTEVVKPYAGERETTAKLFNLYEPGINYHFTAELPGGNFLIVEWNHLSDWENKGDLQHIISLAKTYAEKVEDSFKASTSAKRLDIHIPLANEPVTLNICEHNTTGNVVLIKGSIQTPLKVSMDTIRVLKTFRETNIHRHQSWLTTPDAKTHDEDYLQLKQLQYTFILKDIDEIKNIGNDKAAISDISDKFDSVVNKYRNTWFNEDKWTHNLTVNYFPLNENPKKRMTVKKLKYENEKGRYYRATEIDWGMGAILFRNTVCPITEVGVSYKWPTRYTAYTFARLSTMAFPDIVWTHPQSFDVYPITFINIEFGWIKSKQNMHIPLYQASFGLGYANNPYETPGSGYHVHDPLLPDHIFRTYISFKLSKMTTITWENFTSGYTGISGQIRIF